MPQGDNHPRPASFAAQPRFAGIATFMRLPQAADANGLDVALLGIPWDGGTTNRPGARHGPREIRAASAMCRPVNAATGIQPFELCRCADIGDAPVNPIDLDDTLGRIEAFAHGVAEAGAAPLAAGGDHLATLPVLRALAACGGRPLALVHFDAHSDTSDLYFNTSRYTHGSGFRRAVEEGLIAPERAIQIGLRASLNSADELDFAKRSGMRLVTMDEVAERGPAAIAAIAREVVGEAPAYVSFDVDGLDPAFAPGTGTPEPGGFSTHDAQRMVRGLSGLDIVGGDVVEVSPPFDVGGITAAAGATMMFEILCVLAQARAARS